MAVVVLDRSGVTLSIHKNRDQSAKMPTFATLMIIIDKYY